MSEFREKLGKVEGLLEACIDRLDREHEARARAEAAYEERTLKNEARITSLEHSRTALLAAAGAIGSVFGAIIAYVVSILTK